jgi:hypothetical protein
MERIMVRAKLQVYYTFKLIPAVAEKPAVVECHKWEEATGDHVEKYVVRPGQNYMGCSCPAYRRCKHQNCVQEAYDTGKIDELWKWRWDEKQKWQPLSDIQPIEELTQP